MLRARRCRAAAARALGKIPPRRERVDGDGISKAWTVIKNSEAALGFKLLVSTTGGRHGGGATLSPEAEKLLAAYDGYCAALRRCAEAEFSRAFEGILP